MRLAYSLLAISLICLIGSANPVDKTEIARGRVFHDANKNRKLDAGEKLLAGIKVSNGRDIVVTNEEGAYSLTIDNDDIVFVIKPRGWRTPLSHHNLPQFYYIHKPDGSPDLDYAGVAPTGDLPETINFPLYPQEEPEEFKAILFGDPQPRTRKEVDHITHDVVEELIGTDAAFGVTLGDIVFDKLELFEPLNQSIALIGIPWYNVIGNHDLNMDAHQDHHSDETFERVFGPPYYSFDYGPVHFLVLDDVEWLGREKKYRGGLGPDQMAFIKNDLASIPKDQMVVLMMHIPIIGVENRQELYRLIENRPFCISISGHTHWHEHRFITHKDGWRGPRPHHHIINVTVSGSWWRGTPDERGIPHAMMSDGAPNGYSILSFNGTDYTLDFKAAAKPADYQMRIDVPSEVRVSELSNTKVYVNVFNGSERSKVELRIGSKGEWQEMTKSFEADPQYIRTALAERGYLARGFRPVPGARISSHLWKAELPKAILPGMYLMHVRTTDMHGRTFSSMRSIRILPDDE